TIPIKMLRSQRRGRDPPCWLSEKEPLVGKRRVNFQRCWLPVSRIGLHRRGVERVNCGPKLLDLGEKGVYSSYTFSSYTSVGVAVGEFLGIDVGVHFLAKFTVVESILQADPVLDPLFLLFSQVGHLLYGCMLFHWHRVFSFS